MNFDISKDWCKEAGMNEDGQDFTAGRVSLVGVSRDLSDPDKTIKLHFNAKVSDGFKSGLACGLSTLVERHRIAIAQSVILTSRLMDYYDFDEIERWWISPHPQLNNEIPADVMLEVHGHEKIRDIIDRLDGDVYI